MSVFKGSPQGGSQHELGGLVWEDVEGQGNELLVQEHNYSATTHNPSVVMIKAQSIIVHMKCW